NTLPYVNRGSGKDGFDQRLRQSAEGAAKEGNLAGAARPEDLAGVSSQTGLYNFQNTKFPMTVGGNHPLIAVDALKRASRVGQENGIDYLLRRHVSAAVRNLFRFQ